jgi:hypothetical protein
MAMLALPPDFKEFLQLFNANSVEYPLVGGYAVGYYGYVRATADIDIWIAINPANAQRAVAALEQFGFQPPPSAEKLFLTPENIVRLGVPPFRIEILNSVSGVEFAGCYAAKVVDDLGGVSVNIIGLPLLNANKLASGRGKDLVDIEHLP